MGRKRARRQRPPHPPPPEPSTAPPAHHEAEVVVPAPPAPPPTRPHPSESTNPSRWNCETSPFVAVRYYARDEVTDKYIQDLLKKKKITTMKELNDCAKYTHILPLLKQDQDLTFLTFIRAAATTERKTAKEILGRIMEYDDEEIDPEVVEKFSKGAVAVNCSSTDSRNGRHSLVMGPSGSGKTLFAMKCLGPMVFPKVEGDESQIYTILVDAEDLISTEDSLGRSLTKYIKRKMDSRGIPTGTTVMQLALLVIIDEAGGYASKYFDSNQKIRALHDFLKIDLAPYEFAKGLHLAVVGTGLEGPTQRVSSKKDTLKFRMQPWSLENFEAMVKTSKHSEKAKDINKSVGTFPIFQYLASNARCAHFLTNSLAAALPDALSTKKILPFQSFVDGIISKVAGQYIGSNGLADLKTNEEKIQVAQAALRAITKANIRPKLLFLPNFDDLPPKKRSVAISLLDVHVESVDGELALVDETKNSVSMTPALTVVVARLLDENGNISWGWKGLESIVALGELKIVIQSMSDDGPRGGILHSESAIPAPRSKTKFEVPLVGNSLVVLNGSKAPYADVIAPFRLVQAKFSVDRDKDCNIDFHKEVSKMGLTTADDNYCLNQAVTSVFYRMWKNKQEPVDYRSAATPRADNSIHQQNLYAPFQTLLSEVKTKYAKIECRFDNNRVTIENNGKWLPCEIAAREDFDNKPVTAVFVTNCKSWELQEGQRKKSVTITRDDVEWDGKLTAAKAEEVAGLVPDLRKNVEFQFLLL